MVPDDKRPRTGIGGGKEGTWLPPALDIFGDILLKVGHTQVRLRGLAKKKKGALGRMRDGAEGS